MIRARRSTSSSASPRWLVAVAGDGARRARRDPARVARPPDLPPAPRRAATARRSTSQAAHDGRRRRAHRRGLAVNEGDPRITRVGALLRRCVARRAAQPRQRAARRDVARRARGPTIQVAGRPVHAAPAPAARGQARASPAGRRSTAARRCRGRERIELDLWYVEHRSLRSTCGSCAHARGCVLERRRALQGRDRGLGGPTRERDAGVLLTGVGKRYDIVSAFAAARARSWRPTPTRSRPRSTRRTVRAAVPRIDDPALRARARGRCASEHDVGAVVPLTDLDIEVLARARARRDPAGVRARPRDRRARPTTSTRRTCCSSATGLPSPPTVLPGDRAASPTR